LSPSSASAGPAASRKLHKAVQEAQDNWGNAWGLFADSPCRWQPLHAKENFNRNSCVCARMQGLERNNQIRYAFRIIFSTFDTGASSGELVFSAASQSNAAMYADDASHRSKGQEACIVDETSNKAYFDEDTGTFVTQSCSRRVDLARSDFALMQTLRRPF
jgi:hypothetical protein